MNQMFVPRLCLVAILPLLLLIAACGAGEPVDQGTGGAEEAAATEVVTTEAAVDAAVETAEPAANDEAEATVAGEAITPDADAAVDDEPFVFGMVMVGPYNDNGWSQAHYEGGEYVIANVPDTEFIWIDKVNPADRPNVQVEQVVDDLVEQGAQLIITNSDDFKDGTRVAAQSHPDIPFIHISGDDVLTGLAPDNLGNIMGQMIYGKMVAGCAAALRTETGNIAYLGPLINDETRRLVNSAYLGATYCYNNLREDRPSEELAFEVTWIGFWFNIPGVTLDPTQVANDFINNGDDVLISGIDTTEALIEANKATEAGTEVYALPYDYINACDQAPDVCLGVPYFNWGPAYVNTIEEIKAGTWEPEWLWLPPDWGDLNNLDTSAIGFEFGPALTEEERATLDTFIEGLATDSIVLWQGPLNFQDGTVFLEAGAAATEEQIWYMPQLLEGIEGASE